MTLHDAIQGRRSIRRFTTREVAREEIEAMLDAAVLAPNHRMTQPWRFYVLGPEARHGYGAALGRRKAKRAPDPESAREVVTRVAEEHRDLPSMLAVAMTLAEQDEIREEDYAATFMAIQNLCLTAHGLGLGTHIRTGAVMDDPDARAAAGVAPGERVVATIHLGEPAEIPPVKSRRPAVELTTWVP
jgi:nitroreductase